MRVLFVVYDNDSYISWFPQGIAYLASAVRKAGHNVEIYNQDVYHYPEEHLTEYLKKNKFSVVVISVIGGYYQYRKLLKLSEAINKVKNRPLFLIGGHGPAPEPEYFLKKTGADIVGIDEKEKTIVEILEYAEGKRELKTINGIAFLENNKLIVTQKRELIKDLDTISFPAYDLFPMDHYTLLRAPCIRSNQRAMPILSGRGCTFKCNFCYRLDKGYRPRSVEGIIEEIKLLQKDYNVSYFIFSDELLMAGEKRITEICEGFLKAKLNINWSCNGRLNYAKIELLKLMKKAGCVFINYGIEAVDDNVLKNMNKHLTVKEITEGVKNTLKVGISPGLNIIWGNIGDNLETLRKGVEFLLKYDDQAQLRTIRPVTPYPGSPLYYYAIKKGLLKDVADFYENKHLNSDLLSVNFTELSDDEFYKALRWANSVLVKNYYKKLLKKTLKEINDLYLKKNINFRGFRHT